MQKFRQVREQPKLAGVVCSHALQHEVGERSLLVCIKGEKSFSPETFVNLTTSASSLSHRLPTGSFGECFCGRQQGDRKLCFPPAVFLLLCPWWPAARGQGKRGFLGSHFRQGLHHVQGVPIPWLISGEAVPLPCHHKAPSVGFIFSLIP